MTITDSATDITAVLDHIAVVDLNALRNEVEAVIEGTMPGVTIGNDGPLRP